MYQKLLHTILFVLLMSWGLMAQPDSVNMTAFGGIATEKGVEIAWVTNGEHNVQGYVLERSLDAISFETVKTMPPHIDGVGQKNYYFEDLNIFRQYVYYRVTTLMAGGNEVSNIIAVTRSNMDLPDIMIYPTITSQEVNVIKNSVEDMEGARIRVFNMSGHLLFDKAVAADFLVESVNVESYEAGAYVIELYKGNFASKAKFIKQH